MTRARAILAALAALAALTAPAGARAALAPVFAAPQTITAYSSTIAAANMAVTADAAFVVWVQDVNGDRAVLVSRRAHGPGEQWSAPLVLSDAGESVDGEQLRIAADSDGNVTVLWRTDSSWQIRARTLLRTGGGWSAATTLQALGSTNPVLVPGPDGTVVAAWGNYNDRQSIRIRTRLANSADWAEHAVDIDQGTDSPQSLALAYNGAGDGVVVWSLAPDGGGNAELRAARYAHSAGWSPTASPVAVEGSATSAGELDVAITPLGAAAVLWIDPADGQARAAAAPAGSDTWSVSVLNGSGQSSVLTSLAAGGGGELVALYQTMVNDSDPLVMYASSRIFSRTLAAGASQWSASEPVAGDQFSGLPASTVDRDGAMTALFLQSATPDLSRIGEGVFPGGFAVASRPAAAPGWPAAQGIGNVSLSMAAGSPAITSGPDGDVAILYASAGDGTERALTVALGDANGPRLEHLAIPEAGVPAQELAFSVHSSDLWSGVAGTSWSFGDGTSAAGTDVTHAFAAAGTYSVTVTSTDGAGQRSVAHGEVVVTAPSGDPGNAEADTGPPAPRTDPLAPQRSEPRTFRWVIRIRARVRTRPHRRCAGTVKATTRTGGKSHATRLRLRRSRGSCIARGTITLRRVPAAKPAIRVTLRGRQIKRRTVVVRRSAV